MRFARLLVLAVLLVALTPATALAYPQSVERWRGVIRAEMASQNIPAAERAWLEKAALRCINGESRGNPMAGVARHKKYQGLFQFSPAFCRGRDMRHSGYWSCRRFVKVYKQAGKRGIRRHWRATIGRL